MSGACEAQRCMPRCYCLWCIPRLVSRPRVRYFSLLRQRKAPKRKAGPKACPLTRVPCASHRFGRSPNSQDLPHLRLASPAQTGRLAQSQTGCGARLRLRESNPNACRVEAPHCARSILPSRQKPGSSYTLTTAPGPGSYPPVRLAQPSIAGQGCAAAL